MILARMAQAIKQQNWFQVTIEIIIVVIGIFLGLQVTDWNEGRQERIEEKNYLERVLSDMEESALEQQQQMVQAAYMGENLQYLVTKLMDGTFEEADQGRLISGLDATGFIASPVTNKVTINEMQSSGKMLLIRDIELREAIGSIILSFDEVKARTNYAIQATTTLQPVFAHLALYEYAEDGAGIDGWGYTITGDFAKISSDQDMINRLSNVGGWIRYTSSQLDQHHRNTLDLIAKLKEALNKME